jgi:hypothetical protein
VQVQHETAALATGPAGPELRSCRSIEAVEAKAFAEQVLLSPERTRPVVGITTDRHTRRPTIAPGDLARRIGSLADIVVLETGDATWALSEALPNRLDVFGGAARIWWPGLSVASERFDHPLLFVYGDGAAVAERIEAAISSGAHGVDLTAPRSRSAAALPAPPEPGCRLLAPAAAAAQPGTLTKEGKVVKTATITSIDGPVIQVRGGDSHGVIGYADEKLESLAARLSVGESIPVFLASSRPDGTPTYSTQGLLPRTAAPGLAPPVGRRAPLATSRPVVTDSWHRVPEVYQVGDVVRARVCRVADRSVLVEVLPGAASLVPLGELDWSFVEHPSDLLEVGERVKTKILSLEPERRRGIASIKQAYALDPLPAVSLAPGEPPFLADAGDEEGSETSEEAAAAIDQLNQELDSALADRSALMKRLKAANEQVTDLKKNLRSTEDRLRDLEIRARGYLDPTSSENAFLAAVRVDYARTMNETDREQYPLSRMRVGRDFLDRLHSLDGIPVEKIVEVCAQVACSRAHEVPAREVHELRAGEAGAVAHVRARDGAKAWRCSLQVGTASARRLHWWDIPGEAGRTIEFASVAVHDDFSIRG